MKQLFLELTEIIHAAERTLNKSETEVLVLAASQFKGNRDKMINMIWAKRTMKTLDACMFFYGEV